MNTSVHSNYDLTLHFQKCVKQEIGSCFRIYGLVNLKNLMKLIEVLDLDSNPRNARRSSITGEIIDSLEGSADLFPLLSKGVLIGSMNYKELDRSRFQFSFENRELEGVLDGGHNLLAIGTYVLSKALVSPEAVRELRSVKVWADFKAVYRTHHAEVEEFLRDAGSEVFLNTLVSVEAIVPASDNEIDVLDFKGSLAEIQEARNTNAQLKPETVADKQGLFDPLKELLDPELSKIVEWKSNDNGIVDVRDLVSLSWIPLTALGLEPVARDTGKLVKAPSPQQTYNSKATVQARYEAFMSSEEVSRKNDDNTFELYNAQVRSALKIAAEMPELYEAVYDAIPRLYNEAGGRFGKIEAVKTLNEKSKDKRSTFFQRKVETLVPAGFVAPFVYGFRALLDTDSNGNLYWVEDPYEFLDEHGRELSKIFIEVMLSGNADPQKVGKKAESYTRMFDRFTIQHLKG